MSRNGTRGSVSRFLWMNGEAMLSRSVSRLLWGSPLAGSAGLLVQHDRLHAACHDLLVDHALLDVALRGDVVHEVQHELLEDDAQAAGADVPLERLAGDGLERLVGELELDPFELQDGLVLPDQAVLRLVKDAHQRLLVELLERGDDRQPPDELRNQAVLDQIFGQDLLQELGGPLVALAFDVRAEPERFLVDAALDRLLEADERAAADEQDVGRVDLQELLV